MPAPEGNTNAMKFDTPEKRQQLCRDYVEHVESGLSDECFPECDPQTLRRYVSDFPIDFDIGQMDKAQRKRHLFWEKAGRDGTMGKIEGFNASSWKFNMQNRFDWREKRDDTVKVTKDAAEETMDTFRKEAETAADGPEPEPTPQTTG